MKRINLFLIFLVWVVAPSVAQSKFTHDLEGRVYSKNGDVAATHVLNTTTQRATITDVNGFFSIPVRLNDSLVFSAVQFERKVVVVTSNILESKLLLVPLQEILTELDEVVVTPYNLSGDMSRDLTRLKTDPAVSASTLGLPNSNVKLLTQSERLLREASMPPLSLGTFTAIPFNPIINAISGRTKMLKKRVKRDKKYARTERVREFFADSLYVKDLKIPQGKIDDFMYYCEVDPTFQSTVDSHDRFKIWEYMRKKSLEYRAYNKLE